MTNADCRNWPAIAELSDADLKLFFMMVFYPELLQKLPLAFPELFHDEPQEFCFPLSRVKREEEVWYRIDDPSADDDSCREFAEVCWEHACNELGIPVAVCSNWARD